MDMNKTISYNDIFNNNKYKGNMNRYRVYKHPIGTIEAVKQGWSWPAFFLNSFWAIYKKMWVWGFGALIIGILSYALFGSSVSVVSFADVISLITGFIFGTSGNDWLCQNLESRGFDYMETVLASTPDAAIGIHLRNEANPNVNREPFL